MILDQGDSPQGLVLAHTYPAHLSVAFLHGQQQRHQGVDQLFLHGQGAGRPQLLDHLAIQVDTGGAHVLP